MQIYIGRNGQREGPFTLDQVRAMLAAGQTQPDDLAWHEGAPGWIPLSQLVPAAPPPLASGSPTIPPARPIAASAAAVPQETLAIVSLILGIMGLVMLPVVTSLPAVVCGHLALGRIKRAAGTLGGRGLAIGGLVTGYLGIVACVVVLVVIALFFTAMFKTFGPVTQQWKQQLEGSVSALESTAVAQSVYAACAAYAGAHEGNFPPDLESLVPTYLSDAAMIESEAGPNRSRGRFQYFGGKVSDPSNRILFQSTDAFPDGRRVIVRVGGLVELEHAPAPELLEIPAPPENTSKDR